MLNNSSKIMFLMILMMGTLITVSSNSWLGAWMGLEINLLSFIPLMSDNNLMSTEASLKYFLTQALASVILLFSIIMMMLNSNLMFNNNKFSSMILLSSLLLKSGAAPFHFWFPNIMEGLSWNNSLILMTWQKLAPMILISYEIINSLIWISIILSSLVGSLSGLNQTSLRKLMAFSSINHLSWMLITMQINQSIWLIYFSIYSLLSFSILFFFNMFKISHLNQLFSMYFISKNMKFFLFLNLLSLGGLPPFLGFLPKWLVIQNLMINQELFLLFILMMTTLITLFFYLRISYSAFMINYSENNWINFIKMNKIQNYIHLILSYISIFGLLFLPMFYLM